MKTFVMCGIALLASLGSVSAAEPLGPPVGEWIVEDGVARIRIVDCNTRLWGVISWEKEPGGLDAENPDPLKKSRPTLGMPILLNMKKVQTENRPDSEHWDGKVYNAKNGKLYDFKIRLTAPDKLEIKGCVLGFLCGGETWTRYIDPAAPPPPPAGALPTAKANTAKAKTPVTAGASKTTATAATAIPAAPVDPATMDVCLLPDVAGAAH